MYSYVMPTVYCTIEDARISSLRELQHVTINHKRVGIIFRCTDVQSSERHFRLQASIFYHGIMKSVRTSVCDNFSNRSFQIYFALSNTKKSQGIKKNSEFNKIFFKFSD